MNLASTHFSPPPFSWGTRNSIYRITFSLGPWNHPVCVLTMSLLNLSSDMCHFEEAHASHRRSCAERPLMTKCASSPELQRDDITSAVSDCEIFQTAYILSTSTKYTIGGEEAFCCASQRGHNIMATCTNEWDPVQQYTALFELTLSEKKLFIWRRHVENLLFDSLYSTSWISEVPALHIVTVMIIWITLAPHYIFTDVILWLGCWGEVFSSYGKIKFVVFTMYWVTGVSLFLHRLPLASSATGVSFGYK